MLIAIRHLKTDKISTGGSASQLSHCEKSLCQKSFCLLTMIGRVLFWSPENCIMLKVYNDSKSRSIASNVLQNPWTVTSRLLCPWNSPGQNTRVGSRSLLQGIFPTQGSNPGLLHCRQILYHLSHQGRLRCCSRGASKALSELFVWPLINFY